MKFYIAIALVAIVAAVNAAGIDTSDDHLEQAKQYAEECRAEFVIPDEEFAKLKAGEVFDASENAKCITNCFQEKAGILKDGVLQSEIALAKLSASVGEDKAKSIMAACSDKSGSGKCETAYLLHQCYKQNNAY